MVENLGYMFANVQTIESAINGIVKDIDAKKTFITEFSLKLDPPQPSLRPWHGHRCRSVSISSELYIDAN